MTSSGGVSRVAKGADCKSAAVWLRRFESFFPHQSKIARKSFPGDFFSVVPRNRLMCCGWHIWSEHSLDILDDFSRLISLDAGLLMLGLLASGAACEGGRCRCSVALSVGAIALPARAACETVLWFRRAPWRFCPCSWKRGSQYVRRLQVVLPKFLADDYGWWNFLNPHTYVGRMFNTGGRATDAIKSRPRAAFSMLCLGY